MGGSPQHIPAVLRKTIQSIKEIIAGTHSDDEIYATLKESNMDPNETAQKLLTQDPFHEVKRKWEKKKENASNRDYGDTQLKASSQERGGKAGALLERGAGRGSYLQHHNSYDVGAGRGSSITRDNKVFQNTNIGSNSALSPSMTLQNEKSVAFASEGSSLTASVSINRIVPNGSVAYVHPSQLSRGSWSSIIRHKRSADVKPTSASLIPIEIACSTPTSISLQEQAVQIVEQHSTSSNWANSVSGVYSCTSDPVLVPSHDHCTPGLQRMIKDDVGTAGVWRPSSQFSAVAVSADNSSFSSNLMQLSQLPNCISHESAESMVKSSVSDKHAPAVTHSILHDFDVSHPIELDGDHLSETQAFPSSSDMLGASPTRCSVVGGHFNSRSPQQPVGHQKAVGSNKDWKPKSIDQNFLPVSGVIGTSINSIRYSEASISSVQPPSSAKLEDQTAKLKEKLEELNVRDDQYVIIPNHLQVPEADRTGISFGSFVAGFATNVSSSFANDECDNNYIDLPEASQEAEERNEEHPSRQSKAASFVPSEGCSNHPKEYYSHSSEDYSHHLQTSTSAIENISSSTDDGPSNLSPTAGSLPKPFKQELVAASGSQFSLLQNAMNYTNMESMTQFIQNNPYEPADPHQQDVSHLPSFPQAHDPSSFYTRFLIPGLEGDTRFSPLVSSTSGSNYNGNHPLLSGQSGVSSQEAGFSMVPSTTDPAHVMQKSGTIQARIPPQQQPMLVFPQSAGVNTCQFPSNYLPYHQYLSTLYAPPTVHGFTGNPGYSPRHSESNYNLAAGSSYPQSAAAVKYSLSQHKPGTVSGNTLHGAFPMGYGSYNTPAGYAASPAATGGSGSSFDDIAGPQFKETNLYLPSQQAEGSRLWIQSPARDLSGMQTSSYYNRPAQAQHSAYAATQSTHAAFAPTQSGHSTDARYHSKQPGLARNLDHLLHRSQALGGASGQIGAYKEPNHGQLNWSLD